MSKKKIFGFDDSEDELPYDLPIEPWVEETEQKTQSVPPVAVEVKQNEYYHTALWKNTVPVFMCNVCNHCLEIEDDMKFHVLKHVPESEREKLFEKLMKE
jgi:hypothetical protein